MEKLAKVRTQEWALNSKMKRDPSFLAAHTKKLSPVRT